MSTIVSFRQMKDGTRDDYLLLDWCRSSRSPHPM
jgi:hypothetical protein